MEEYLGWLRDKWLTPSTMYNRCRSSLDDRRRFSFSCLFCHFQEKFLLFLFLSQSDGLFEEPKHSEDELDFVASQLLDPQMSTSPRKTLLFFTNSCSLWKKGRHLRVAKQDSDWTTLPSLLTQTKGKEKTERSKREQREEDAKEEDERRCPTRDNKVAFWARNEHNDGLHAKQKGLAGVSVPMYMHMMSMSPPPPPPPKKESLQVSCQSTRQVCLSAL